MEWGGGGEGQAWLQSHQAASTMLQAQAKQPKPASAGVCAKPAMMGKGKGLDECHELKPTPGTHGTLQSGHIGCTHTRKQHWHTGAMHALRL